MYTLAVTKQSQVLARVALQPGFLVLGREVCCDVVLNDAQVSGQHLAVFIEPDQSVRFQDLGSKNCTRLNGNVAPYGTVTPEDVIDICGFELRLCPPDEGDREIHARHASVPAIVADIPTGSTTAVSVAPEDFARSSQDARRLQWLKEVASEICSALDHRELLGRILDAALGTFDAQRAFIGVVSHQSREFELRLSREKGNPEDTAWQPSNSILDLVLTRRQAVLTADASADDRFKQADSVLQSAVRSAMCVPLVHGDDVLGAIYVDSREVSKGFGEEDVSYLVALAHFAAIAVYNAAVHHRVGCVAEGLRRQLAGAHTILAVGRTMKDLLQRVAQVAASDCNVLVAGETGSGKELIAREIHRLSARRDELFVPVNSAHGPETLIESELFGHVRGAFSGAVKDRTGKFQQADGGTLFLDEIGDMGLSTQAKVLRAIQFGEIQRVGDDGVTHVNVRTIAATNKDLDTEIAEGRFRRDLLFRLDVASLRIAPLRERKEDLPLLAGAYVDRLRPKYGNRVARVSHGAMRALLAHHWPGNVRELENAIEHAMIVCQERVIRAGDLPDSVRRDRGVPNEGLPTLMEVERQHVRRVLAAVGWNVTRAARILGVSRRTLHQRIRDFSLQRPE